SPLGESCGERQRNQKRHTRSNNREQPRSVSLLTNQNESRRTEQSAPSVANFCALLGQVSRAYHPDVRTHNNGSNRRSEDRGWPQSARYWRRKRRAIAHHLRHRRTHRISN